jgi:hypothetical protein
VCLGGRRGTAAFLGALKGVDFKGFIRKRTVKLLKTKEAKKE